MVRTLARLGSRNVDIEFLPLCFSTSMTIIEQKVKLGKSKGCISWLSHHEHLSDRIALAEVLQLQREEGALPGAIFPFFRFFLFFPLK